MAAKQRQTTPELGSSFERSCGELDRLPDPDRQTKRLILAALPLVLVAGCGTTSTAATGSTAGTGTPHATAYSSTSTPATEVATTDPPTTTDIPTTNAPTVAPTTAPPSAAATNAASACSARPTNPDDIIFRFKDPGTNWNVQELGNGSLYNNTTNTCQTAPDFMLASVPPGDGHCGEVALVSDNPGYNADNVTGSAPPLRHVIASVGSCS